MTHLAAFSTKSVTTDLRNSPFYAGIAIRMSLCAIKSRYVPLDLRGSLKSNKFAHCFQIYLMPFI